MLSLNLWARENSRLNCLKKKKRLDDNDQLNSRNWLPSIFFFCFQNIIAYEYIPAFLGKELPEYTGYKLDVHPGISHVFQSSAFRFGHTLIPPGIYRRDGKCNYRKTAMGNPALRLCAYWWDSSVSTTLYSKLIINWSSKNCKWSFVYLPTV